MQTSWTLRYWERIFNENFAFWQQQNLKPNLLPDSSFSGEYSFPALIWWLSGEELSWPFAEIMGISPFNKLSVYSRFGTKSSLDFSIVHEHWSSLYSNLGGGGVSSLPLLANLTTCNFPVESGCCRQVTSLVWNCLNEVRTGEGRWEQDANTRCCHISICKETILTVSER